MNYRFFDCRKSHISVGVTTFNNAQKKDFPFCFGLMEEDWHEARKKVEEVRRWFKEQDVKCIDQLDHKYVAFTNEDDAAYFKLIWG